MRKFGIGAFVAAACVAAGCFVSTPAASGDAVCYVLRELGGKIALFRETDDYPIAVYETPVTWLCPADAELLREGIRLKTEAEVTRIIEDLCLN